MEYKMRIGQRVLHKNVWVVSERRYDYTEMTYLGRDMNDTSTPGYHYRHYFRSDDGHTQLWTPDIEKTMENGEMVLIEKIKPNKIFKSYKFN